jgi:oxygen-independent coproporphyrinogen-3 oxidase
MATSSMTQLLAKYDRPVPRYTSYPAVPNWQKVAPPATQWLQTVQHSLADDPAISLYIHLPFCENLCTYCACNKRITKNHTVEEPYIEAVLKEWQYYLAALPKTPIIKTLHLGGGTPTFFSPESLEVLLNGILATSERAEDYEFSFEAHPTSTSYEHLQILRRFGFDRISIGVQDFDQDVLRLINRHQTQLQVHKVTHQARALGYRSINFDFVYGLPGQGFTQLKYNHEQIALLHPDRIAFYSYAHVPWRNPSQRAYDESDLMLGAAKQQLYNYGRNGLQQLGYLTIGMDHFALPGDRLVTAAQTGKLHRNFMGYTDQHTTVMIGLGASAISDSWGAFVQNEHQIETYQQRINAGELPITKGHLCSEEDQILRRHILQLSCNYRTVLDDTLRQLAAWPTIEARLQEFKEDDLLVVHDNVMAITPLGRPFVRNICTAFDQYLAGRDLGEERYSRAV